MDVLLTHAYYLYEDPVERQIMKPYPPLGLLYVASHLRSSGYEVEVSDATFMSQADHLYAIRSSRAPIVGVYINMMTRANALRIIREAKAAGR